MMGNHLYTLLAGAPEVLRKRVLVDEWILILSVKKIWNNISLILLKTDFSENIFYFKNAIYAFLQQKSSEILRMFKIRIMTQTVIEMQFLPSQHSNAEEISSRMQKGSIFKKNVWEISFISKLCLLWFRVVIKSVGFRSVMRILNQAIFCVHFKSQVNNLLYGLMCIFWCSWKFDL